MASRSPSLHHDVRQAFFYQPLPSFLAYLAKLPLPHLHTALTWTSTEYQNLLSSAVELSFIIDDIRTLLWSLRSRDIDERRATCSERFWLASEAGKGGLAEVLEGDLLEIQGAIEGWNVEHVRELGVKEGLIGELEERVEREEWRVKMLREEVAKLKKEMRGKEAEIVMWKEKAEMVGGRNNVEQFEKVRSAAAVEEVLPSSEEDVMGPATTIVEEIKSGVLVAEDSAS